MVVARHVSHCPKFYVHGFDEKEVFMKTILITFLKRSRVRTMIRRESGIDDKIAKSTLRRPHSATQTITGERFESIPVVVVK